MKIREQINAAREYTIGRTLPGSEIPEQDRAGWGWKCHGTSCGARGNGTPDTALPTRDAAVAAFSRHLNDGDGCPSPQRRVGYTTFPVAKHATAA